MGTGKRLDIAQRTFDFAIRVVKLAHFLDQKPGIGRTLSKQILRSGTSVGANVEESRAAQSKSDFIHKLQISLKESRETVYWLRLLSGSNVVPAEQINDLLLEAEEITRILGASVVTARKRRNIVTAGFIALASSLLGLLNFANHF